jgi:hypothetical protein
MKTLSPALQAHLDTGATTLCWCWRLTRRDGVKLGFTDHDRDLVFDGTTFEAAAGFTATEIKDAVGLGSRASSKSRSWPAALSTKRRSRSSG